MVYVVRTDTAAGRSYSMTIAPAAPIPSMPEWADDFLGLLDVDGCSGNDAPSVIHGFRI